MYLAKKEVGDVFRENRDINPMCVSSHIYIYSLKKQDNRKIRLQMRQWSHALLIDLICRTLMVNKKSNNMAPY